APAGGDGWETLSVREAAEHLGVSQRRVRALIAEGRLAAQKLGGRWEISRSAVQNRVADGAFPVRPMSPRSFDMLLERLRSMVDTAQEGRLRADAVERLRVERRLQQLRSAAEPARLLRAWSCGLWPKPEIRWVAPDPDLLDRLPLTGVSHPGIRMSVPGELEVQMRKIPTEWSRERMAETPVKLVIHRRDAAPDLMTALVDLAHRPGVREDRRVAEVVRNGAS
ncbi:helix-turn-helix domain-containing protein, partial [Amycolatopsis sp. H6(2020)]|nr:helix-turn-helix domain-containing protein [Amycolatopsis sp. H6(2020)]